MAGEFMIQHLPLFCGCLLFAGAFGVTTTSSLRTRTLFLALAQTAIVLFFLSFSWGTPNPLPRVWALLLSLIFLAVQGLAWTLMSVIWKQGGTLEFRKARKKAER